MSQLTEDEKLQKLAALIGKQFEQKFAAYAEVTDDSNKAWQQNFDNVIAAHLAPIKSKVDKLDEDMQTVKAAVKETNKDLKVLDKAAGQTEHRVDLNLKFAEMSFDELRKQNKAIMTSLGNHEKRLTKNESA